MEQQKLDAFLQLIRQARASGAGAGAGNGEAVGRRRNQLQKFILLQQLLKATGQGPAGVESDVPAESQVGSPLRHLLQLKKAERIEPEEGEDGQGGPDADANGRVQFQNLQRIQNLLSGRIPVDELKAKRAAEPADPAVARRQRRQSLEFRLAWLESLVEKVKKEIEEFESARTADESES